EILKTKKMKSRSYAFAFGNDKSALKNGEITLLNASDPVPVSDAFVQDKNAVVGLVVRRVDPRPANFEEVSKQVFRDVKASRSHAATVQQVKDFAEKLNGCKSAAERDALLKTVPAEKVGDVKFSEMGDSPAVEWILGANAMLSLRAGEGAAVDDQLAVLASRTVPETPMTEEIMTQYRALCRQQKFALYCYQLDDDVNAHCHYDGIDANRFDR
ncbi:MAG: hypothetical protein MJ016_03355, partial [Victivallaceae bacterium]|nr:hypothetical protein [Victivallaceae bacterium]